MTRSRTLAIVLSLLMILSVVSATVSVAQPGPTGPTVNSAPAAQAQQVTAGGNVSRVAFDYAQFGGNLNIEVNGDRIYNISQFDAAPPDGVDGATIGGASVTVTSSGSTGHVEITGEISSFSLGGQEMYLDNVEFGPASNPNATVTFGSLSPMQSSYVVGDTFTANGVSMAIEPFTFSDGTTYRQGEGRQVNDTNAGGPRPEFYPGNVNLWFNVTSAATGDPDTGDEGSGTNVITGFHRPTLDGQLYGHTGQSLPEGTAPEWTDGHNATMAFVAAEGEDVRGRAFVKTVGGSLFTGWVGGVGGVLDARRVSVRLDRDGSGADSAGDVRLTATPGSESAIGADRRSFAFRRIEVFRNGEFVPLDDPALDGVGTIALRTTEAGTRIETRVDTETLDEVLGDPASGNESGERLGVDVSIRTDTDSYDLGGDDDRYSVSGIDVSRDQLQLPRQDVGVDHVEVTQAIQTRDNALGLVKNKTTLARVFVTPRSSASTNVEVTLTALAPNRGTSCPCSVVGTRSKTFSAPPGPLNRSRLDHSANFVLPEAWTRQPLNAGTPPNESAALVLRASIQPAGFVYDFDQSDNEVTESLVFNETYNPVIATVRVNEGTASSPVQESAANASMMKTHFRHAYPVAGVRYNELGREVLGPQQGVTDSGLINNLNQVASKIAVARVLALLFGVETPPTDQVFGISERDKGLSDPQWWSSSSDSKVAFGDVGNPTPTFRVPFMVMAHEINHNLGNDSWGRHVSSRGSSDPTYGCGATGPDDQWQQRFDDGLIHEVGWHPNNGTIRPTYPDFMTYCTVDPQPENWISGYRWERLLERFEEWDPGNPVHPDLRSSSSTSTNALSATPLAEASPNSTARVISGFLYRNGTGELEPSFEQPGFAQVPSRTVEEPRAVLVVEYAERDTLRIPLDARFRTVEGDAVNASSFTVTVPDDGGVEAIRLLDPETGEPLDSMVGTGFELGSTTIDVPQAFERGEPTAVPVSVETTAEQPVYTQLLYSPVPDAKLWYPIGPNWKPVRDEQGLERSVTFTELPGGEAAQFKLLVSDGVDTRSVESERFAVEPLPPDVSFSVVDPIKVPAGTTLSVDVSTRDQLGRPLPARNLAWELRTAEGELLRSTDGGQSWTGSIDEPGEYRLTVTGTDPRTGASATATARIVVEHPSLPDRTAATSFDAAVRNASTSGPLVRLALRPTSQSTAVGTSATYDLVFDPASDGIGSYDLNVSVSNTSIATIDSVQPRLGPNPTAPATFNGTTVAADGSTVRIRQVGVQSETGNVTLATVTLASHEPGNASLAFSNVVVGDRNDSQYAIDVIEGATLTVRSGPVAPDVGGEGNPATDPDGDDLYEDVNGDLKVNVIDAAVLLGAFDKPVVQNNAALFDYNRDLKVNILDIAALLGLL